ncbi:MAG: hypothetical protein AAGH15_22055 [Myxococcota bacterium]
MKGTSQRIAAVLALGGLLACGDAASVFEAPMGGGVSPGSGALVVRVETSAGSPVPGAELFVDGSVVGLTDSSGTLEVADAASVFDLSVAASGARITWLGVAGRDVRIPLAAPAPAPSTMREVSFATEPAPGDARRELRVGVVQPLPTEAGTALSRAASATCDASVSPCTVSLTVPPGARQVFGLVVDVVGEEESPVAIGHGTLDEGSGTVMLAPVPTVRRGVTLPAPLAEAPFDVAGVIGVPGLGLGTDGVWVVPVAAESGDEVMLPALEGTFADGRHWLFARQDGAEGAFAETRVIGGEEPLLAPPELLPPPRAFPDPAGLRWDVGPGVLVEAFADGEALLWLDADRAADAAGPLAVTAYELAFAPDSLRLATRVDAERRTRVSWAAALRR